MVVCYHSVAPKTLQAESRRPLPSAGKLGVIRKCLLLYSTTFTSLLHLGEKAILPFSLNADLKQSFTTPQVAERYGWRKPLPGGLEPGISGKQLISIHYHLLFSGLSAPYLQEKRRTCRALISLLFPSLIEREVDGSATQESCTCHSKCYNTFNKVEV